jgi:hypothetical protein
MSGHKEHKWVFGPMPKWTQELQDARNHRWTCETDVEQAEKLVAALKNSKELLVKASGVIETLVSN